MNTLENVLKKWEPNYKIKFNYEYTTGKISIKITDKSEYKTEIHLDNPENIQLDIFIDNYLTELHQKNRNEKINTLLK